MAKKETTKESKPAAEQEIKEAIIKVLKKGKVESQDELYTKVKKFVKTLSIKPERLRLIASEIPEVNVIVETKKGMLKVPDICPSCHTELTKIKAKNLCGEVVVVGLKCEKCKYYGSIRDFAPFRYRFELKK
jgi:DNA-directed RNA polymerase subunit F